MAAEDVLKLQQYLRTQQLIRDVRFENAVPLASAAGAENINIATTRRSDSWIINRVQDSIQKSDMTLVASSLRDITDILDYRKEIGQKSPLSTFFENLRDRAERGGHVTWQEFQNAIDTFSADKDNLTALQDQINNIRLATGTEGTEAQESLGEEPSNIITFPQPKKPTDESPPPKSGQPGTTTPLGGPTTPIVYRAPKPTFSERIEEKLSKTSTKPIQTITPGPQNSPKVPDNARQRISASNRAIRRTKGSSAPKRILVTRPPVQRKGLSLFLRGNGSGGYLRAALAGNGNQYIARRLINRYGPRGLVSGLNRYSAWESNIYRSVANKTGITALQNMRSGFYRWMGRLTNNFGRSLGGWGTNAVRGAGQGVGQAGRLAGQTLSTFTKAAAPVAGASVPIIIIIIIILLFIFIWWWGDQTANSECNKPTGEMRMVKRQGGIGSLEVDPSKIEAAVPNGQKIDFVIEASYQLACRTRFLSSVVVTDRIPEGTEYIDGSATSGFYQTNGEPTKGVYDPGTRTLTWTFQNFPMSNPVFIYFSIQPNANTVDTWVMNEATVRYTEGGRPGLSGGGTINVQSATLQAVIDQAAQRVGMEPALLKAFLRVEAQGVLNYSEEEFQFFSTPGWWEGLVDNASTREGNDPTIVRGYGYNTCAYVRCAAGADVRGVAQFEAKTWEGIAKQLTFSDNHAVDRRIATDAIFGSALLNRENAEYYTGSPSFEWTEEVIRAAGRIYCGGKSVARTKLLDGACMADGKQYEDLLWGFYLEYSGK